MQRSIRIAIATVYHRHDHAHSHAHNISPQLYFRTLQPLVKMTDLEAAKNRLVEELKDKIVRYWELMKSWYRRKIAKDDFDAKAKALLGEGHVHLHNEFLFAILVKCQTGLQPEPLPVAPEVISTQQPIPPPPQPPPPGPLTPRPRAKRQRSSPPLEPIPYGALDPLRYHFPPKVQLVGGDLDTLMLCSHELLLPDRVTLHTRMLLGAWEAGLDAVSEEAADLLLLALEVHLKNVLQALISHRTSWQLRQNGHFQHSFGCGPSGRGLPRPQHRFSSSSPSSEEPLQLVPECAYEGDKREAAAAIMAAQSSASSSSQPISLFHVRDTLMLNRSSIPVHPVFSCCMERVLAGMWHAGAEEEAQRQEVEQWQRTRQPLSSLLPPST